MRQVEKTDKITLQIPDGYLATLEVFDEAWVEQKAYDSILSFCNKFGVKFETIRMLCEMDTFYYTRGIRLIKIYHAREIVKLYDTNKHKLHKRYRAIGRYIEMIRDYINTKGL